jgi:hypothetical protein
MFGWKLAFTRSWVTVFGIYRVGVGWSRNHRSQTIRPRLCMPIPVNNMLYKPHLPTPPLVILIQIHGNWVGVKMNPDSYPAPPPHLISSGRLRSYLFLNVIASVEDGYKLPSFLYLNVPKNP